MCFMLQGGVAARAEAEAQGGVASRAQAWAPSAGSAGSRRAPQGSSGACRADATSEPSMRQVKATLTIKCKPSRKEAGGCSRGQPVRWAGRVMSWESGRASSLRPVECNA